MKTLVLFYSLEGNTEFIANTVAEKLGADILKLETVKPFPKEGFNKFFKGGMSVVFKSKPKLSNKNIDLSPYDSIIIGTPIWAGSFASPFNTLFKSHPFSGKKVAFFTCSGGGDDEKCLENFKAKLSGNSFVGSIAFKEPLKQDKEEITQNAIKWAEGLSL